MLALLKENAEGDGWEDPEVWARRFGTTTEHIARLINLPEDSMVHPDQYRQPDIQTRMIEVHCVLNRVRPWFKSDLAAWVWYISEPLATFGRLTPTEVIRQFGDKGIQSLHDYITAKEMGGYE